MIYSLEPYVGALPLRFGMRPSEVEALIGPPAMPPTFLGGRLEHRPDVHTFYDPEHELLEKVVFDHVASVSFAGHDLFRNGDVIAFLRQFDSCPVLLAGSVVFFNLGIEVKGFHDDGDKYKYVGMFRRGELDAYRELWVPFDSA